MVNAPARAPDCTLEFLKLSMGELYNSSGQWELIGQVVLQEDGVQDPFAEKYRAIVRPRACAMGGEAISIALSATSEGFAASGSSTSYAVLRKRTQATDKPTTF